MVHWSIALDVYYCGVWPPENDLCCTEKTKKAMNALIGLLFTVRFPKDISVSHPDSGLQPQIDRFFTPPAFVLHAFLLPPVNN